MSKTKFYFFSLMLIISFSNYAQKYSISGYISDKESGEKLIGANLFDKQHLLGTTSNTYGFYSLTLPADTYNLVISYVGYTPIILKVKLDKNQSFNIQLEPVLELKEFVVVGDQTERIEDNTQMSMIKIPVAQIKAIPAMFGEVDVLKVLQLLPGVQSGMEGASGIYVRGGGPDQNLILLDGTPVYNASHLFGFFSVFNADAIKNVELIKGGFPARYGGRLSSVIDISMKEGNMKQIHGEGSIGLIASKITLEGPIIKDKTSFLISARRTYLDVILQPIARFALSTEQRVTAGYFFYDFNAKINHKISEKDHLYLSLYTGDDKFYLNGKPYSHLNNGIKYTNSYSAGLVWGNLTSALRWNHQYNNKLFSNFSLTYSKYKFNIKDEKSNIMEMNSQKFNEFYSINYISGISDIAGKIDFDFLPLPNHFIKFGTSLIYHTFKPGVTAFYTAIDSNKFDSSVGASNVYAYELAVYIEDDYKITKNLKANIGLHYSGFYVNEKYYNNFQPRFAVRYMLSKDLSMKASFASMQQYIHLLTNSSIGLPTDLWVPATDKIRPQNSQQVAFGLAKTYKDNFQISIEGYYKRMNNLIEYKDGASWLNTDVNWENKVDAGKGWSYGGEFLIEKKNGKTTGWIGYTLSWSNRQFPNINFGEIYPYKYDRRHDISVVYNQKITEKFDFAFTWVYGTGNAITLPVARAIPVSKYDWGSWMNNHREVQYFEKKNDYRMASYHRLDVGFNYFIKIKKATGNINLSVYNAYSRKNPFFYIFGKDDYGNRVLYRLSLFPVIPSLSFGLKF